MWTKSGIIAFETNFKVFYYTISDGDLFALVSKAFLTAVLSILGYIFTISNETKIVLPGILSEFNSSIISSKWLKSLIFVSILLVSGAQTTSMKRDKLSMAVLHPVVKRLTGLFVCGFYMIST